MGTNRENQSPLDSLLKQIIGHTVNPSITILVIADRNAHNAPAISTTKEHHAINHSQSKKRLWKHYRLSIMPDRAIIRPIARHEDLDTASPEDYSSFRL
jgi:hypothetical protein